MQRKRLTQHLIIARGVHPSETMKHFLHIFQKQSVLDCQEKKLQFAIRDTLISMGLNSPKKICLFIR